MTEKNTSEHSLVTSLDIDCKRINFVVLSNRCESSLGPITKSMCPVAHALRSLEFLSTFVAKIP